MATTLGAILDVELRCERLEQRCGLLTVQNTALRDEAAELRALLAAALREIEALKSELRTDDLLLQG